MVRLQTEEKSNALLKEKQKAASCCTGMSAKVSVFQSPLPIRCPRVLISGTVTDRRKFHLSPGGEAEGKPLELARDHDQRRRGDVSGRVMHRGPVENSNRCVLLCESRLLASNVAADVLKKTAFLIATTHALLITAEC